MEPRFFIVLFAISLRFAKFKKKLNLVWKTTQTNVFLRKALCYCRKMYKNFVKG